MEITRHCEARPLRHWRPLRRSQTRLASRGDRAVRIPTDLYTILSLGVFVLSV
jgi:hypothetical protein